MKLVKSAKGMRGMIIISPKGSVFRVTDPSGEFKDYHICQHDLDVEITDDDAFIYNLEEGILDYSPQTLGYNQEVRHDPASALTSPNPTIRWLAEDFHRKKDE